MPRLDREQQRSNKPEHVRGSPRTSASFFRSEKALLRYASVSCIFLGLVAFIWVLVVARPIILPVVTAFIIGLIAAPLGERIQKLGIPTTLANLIIISNLVAIFLLAYAIIGPKVGAYFADFPDKAQKIAIEFERVLRPLEQLQSAIGRASNPGDAKPGSPVAVDIKALAVSGVGALSPALTQIFIFAFSLVLFLIDRPLIKNAIVLAFNTREKRLEVLRFVNQIEDSLSQYLSTVLLINIGIGVITTSLLFALDVPGYAALGVFAFLLNFLPFIGPLFMKGVLLLLGIATYPTLVQGLLPFIFYTLVVVIESNIVTPVLVGRKFSMRPLAVFMSIVFWTWLWGVVGALLAVPILVICSTVIDRFVTEDKISLPG